MMIKVSPDQLDLQLSFFRPIRANALEKMTASLIKYGQLTPITAVENDGRMTLVDGFKRHRSAKQLGMERLSITPLKKSSSEAKALIYLLNRPASFSMITEAMLVRDLIEVEGLNQVETAIILERHKSWVSRRLGMIRSLAPEVIEDIKLTLVPAGVGSSLARLPRDNQADFSVAVQRHELKSQEVQRLVDIWCKAKDPGVRQCLLESPRQALEIVRPDKEKWLSLVETILSKMSDLNRQVQKTPLSRQMAQTLTGFSDQLQTQLKRLSELTAQGDNHEPVK